MKKTAAFIICCNIFFSAFSQQIDHKVMDRADGSLQYFFTVTDIEGNPFLKDSWNKANAITVNGYVFPKLDVKFDTYNSKFIYNKNDTAFEFTPQVTTIDIFPNESDTSNKQVFKKGFKINNIINESKFLQVLTEGKATFLKLYKKEVEDFEVYGDAIKHKRFKQTEQYYIFLNGQYTSVKLTKKDLESVLSSKASEVSAFMQKNNLSGKDEKSWIAVINYYNTL